MVEYYINRRNICISWGTKIENNPDFELIKVDFENKGDLDISDIVINGVLYKFRMIQTDTLSNCKRVVLHTEHIKQIDEWLKGE